MRRADAQQVAPGRGATLRTFFIGQCLFRFANVYKRWEGEIRRSSIWTSTEDEDLLTALGGTRCAYR